MKRKHVDLRIKEELFNAIGVKLGQLHYELDLDDETFYLAGSMTNYRNDELDDYLVFCKINFCDKENGIIHIAQSMLPCDFKILKYDSFETYRFEIGKIVDISKIHHIEIFPCIIRKMFVTSHKE